MCNDSDNLVLERDGFGPGTVKNAESGNEPDMDSVHEGDLSRLRQQRIMDYLDAALHSPMPEVAVLGGVTADLAKMALRLNESLDEVVTGCESPSEYFHTIPRGMELMLKVSRQIERCSRLARELSRPQGPDTYPGGGE